MRFAGTFMANFISDARWLFLDELGITTGSDDFQNIGSQTPVGSTGCCWPHEVEGPCANSTPSSNINDTITPWRVCHIAGLTNTVADALSRQFEPGVVDWQLPSELVGVERVLLPTRSEGYDIVPYSPRDSGGNL